MNLWYVIQTKPKKEGEAASYLLTKGLEVFNPLTEAFSPRNGKIDKVWKSLFPNYVFVKFDLDQSYNLVRWARGVKKVLGFGEYPSPLSDEVIETIKKRTDANGIVRKTCCFEPNDLIRIKSGPLRELLGIFDRWVADSDRVRILLNLIGYQPTIELHYSLLEKVA
jgi:transcriptional antiterminator RfaH